MLRNPSTSTSGGAVCKRMMEQRLIRGIVVQRMIAMIIKLPQNFNSELCKECLTLKQGQYREPMFRHKSEAVNQQSKLKEKKQHPQSSAKKRHRRSYLSLPSFSSSKKKTKSTKLSTHV